MTESYNFTYPGLLVKKLRQSWESSILTPEERLPELKSDRVIAAVLGVAFHASMLVEEGRHLGFRLAVISRREAEEEQGRKSELQRNIRLISFDHPRVFSVGELLRLSPSTDPTRVLICVEEAELDEEHVRLQIWGLIDAGSSWWDFIHGESSAGYPPPNCLTVSSTAPGHLAVSREGLVFLTLRCGEITTPVRGVLAGGPVGDFLRASGEHLYQEVIRTLHADRYDPQGHDDSYPKRSLVTYLERLLFHVRRTGHGGTILIIPDEITATDSRLTDRITIKYRCEHRVAWSLLLEQLVTHRRFYDFYFGLQNKEMEINYDNFLKFRHYDFRREEIEASIADSVRFLASLAEVDGAVVLTDRLRLVGFGGEVTAVSPSLTMIKVALDAEGVRGEMIPIDTYGTRHRSAFRLCSSYESCIAFVVSQDGGVKAVKRVGSHVVLWPDINEGVFGI